MAKKSLLTKGTLQNKGCMSGEILVKFVKKQ